MGILGRFDDERFQAAVRHVAEAARTHGKSAGILLPKPADFEHYWNLGYRFIASGSDGVLLNNAARALTAQLNEARQKAEGRIGRP
jgi:2-keto-3-deoxy-L-rhamnonate aldolase RhmA